MNASSMKRSESWSGDLTHGLPAKRAKYDIASSENGFVKMFLTHDSGRAETNSRIVDRVIENLEAKYQKSTATQSPDFSVSKVMNELCECFWELANSPSNGAKPDAVHQVFDEIPNEPRPSVKDPNYHVQDISRGEERVEISLVNDDNVSMELPKFFYIPRNIVYKDAYVNFSLARISNDSCCSQCWGNCLSSDLPCACAGETRGEFAYTLEGLVKQKFLDECVAMSQKPERHHFYFCECCPLENNRAEKYKGKRSCKGHLMRKFIKECWSKCGCSRDCGNRVVQRGIVANLQVFVTPEGKGWGLRTLQALKKGSFVCEYVGEIVTNQELHKRNKRRAMAKERHTYPVLLDADWGSERVLKDEEALCLDATEFGNCGRFVNHRCIDANLVEIPVEVETPDHHYYHLAFFTTRDVEPMEELTWDYGIQFDDKNHPIEAFKCKCGSKFCRDTPEELLPPE